MGNLQVGPGGMGWNTDVCVMKTGTFATSRPARSISRRVGHVSVIYYQPLPISRSSSSFLLRGRESRLGGNSIPLQLQLQCLGESSSIVAIPTPTRTGE